MNANESSKLSRRKFLKQGVLAVSAIGMSGAAIYGVFHGKTLRSARNMFRMGHCAPTIMKTLLEMNEIKSKHLILYAGGLAGGIAGGSTECGGITTPLMVLSVQNDNLSQNAESLTLINKCQRYTKEFITYNGSCNCDTIRKGGITSCMNVICNFHKPLLKALSIQSDLPNEKNKSYSMLLKIFNDNKFHCTHNVLENLTNDIHLTDELLCSSWIFIGGSAFQQLTCGALTAGVIALSSQNSRIENSYSRVARMLWLMMNDDKNAMREDINHFNRSINLSETLGTWFRTEFGYTSCYDICGLDFSKVNDSERYLSSGCIQRCKIITEMVAQKVRKMI